MKVSIIIPTFNRAAFLLQALDSIIDQKYKNVEVIIVDDGSTDNTKVILDKYISIHKSSKKDNIKFLHQPNSGACIARNLGVTKSSGDYILFMDSDDLLTFDGLANGLDKLNSADIDFVHLKVQRCDENTNPIDGQLIGSSYTSSPYDIAGYHWQTMGAIYRRRVVEMVGPWNPELSGSQDWEYQARVKMSGTRGLFVDSIIGYWRTHGNDRVGTKGFNIRYIASVEKACISIYNNAKEKNLLDKKLKKRLQRRLLIHAIEAGANGAIEDRNRLLKSAKVVGGCFDFFASFLLRSVSIDSFIFFKLLKKR